MSGIEQEAYNPIGARLGKVRAFPVTTSSAIFDLSAATEIYADISGSRMIRLRADGGDVYYAFNSANSGSIDQTNTTQGNATQCDVIPAGQYIDIRIPRGGSAGNAAVMCQYLLVKGSVACTLRVSISSVDASSSLTA